MTSPPDLETVLSRLLAAKINASVGTVSPAQLGARIHDPGGGPDIVKEFGSDAPPGAIAAWLLATAEQLYPGRLDGAGPPHPGLW